MGLEILEGVVNTIKKGYEQKIKEETLSSFAVQTDFSRVAEDLSRSFEWGDFDQGDFDEYLKMYPSPSQVNFYLFTNMIELTEVANTIHAEIDDGSYPQLQNEVTEFRESLQEKLKQFGADTSQYESKVLQDLCQNISLEFDLSLERALSAHLARF